MAEEEEGGNAFSKTGALTIKSSSSSSGGLAGVLGLSREGSLESLEDDSTAKPGPILLHRSLSDSGIKALGGTDEHSSAYPDLCADSGENSENTSPSSSIIHRAFAGEIFSSRVSTCGGSQYTQFGPREEYSEEAAKQAPPTQPTPPANQTPQPHSGYAFLGLRPLTVNPESPTAVSETGGQPQMLPVTVSSQLQAASPAGLPTSPAGVSKAVAVVHTPRNLNQQHLPQTTNTSLPHATTQHPPPHSPNPNQPQAANLNLQSPKQNPHSPKQSLPRSPNTVVVGDSPGKPPGGFPSDLSPRARQEQEQMLQQRPPDLASLLRELGLSKYLATFEDQDVDLPVFLSLTDNDLKEVGIK